MTVQISRILHAGYVFESEGVQIFFDPLFENPFSYNCYAFPSVTFDTKEIQKLRPSAVFISHYHDDHCSLESLALLDRATPIYLFCIIDELEDLIRKLGFSEVYSIQLDIPISLGPFQITPRRALDQDVDSIFHIAVGGLNILNVVDSWIDDFTLKKLSQTQPWDLVLWPFQTMRELEVLSPSRSDTSRPEIPHEHLSQLQVLNPRVLVPSSCQFIFEEWSWYNRSFFPISYEGFTQQVQVLLPDSHVVRLDPSCSIFLSPKGIKPAPSLPWVIPTGAQNVDYKYEPNLPVPSTATLATHFTQLTTAQTQRVINYCDREILARFASLGEDDEPYFKNPRLWLLSIFDHLGKEARFYYLVTGQTLTRMDSPTEPLTREIEWSTEIPISKLYGALELGESLTSIYIRINDKIFSEQREKELAGVDILKDPLMRCLFEGQFASYQKAQLSRIQN